MQKKTYITLSILAIPFYILFVISGRMLAEGDSAEIIPTIVFGISAIMGGWGIYLIHMAYKQSEKTKSLVIATIASSSWAVLMTALIILSMFFTLP